MQQYAQFHNQEKVPKVSVLIQHTNNFIILIQEVNETRKEKKEANTIYMCGHDWCTFSLRPKD